MKRAIHTTIDVNIITWLNNECKSKKLNQNELLEKIIEYYRKNYGCKEKLDTHRELLKQLIHEEVVLVVKNLLD